MAKARIVYEVDDKQLNELQKQLGEIKGQNKEVEESFAGANKEVKKTGGVLSDLKTTVAGLGLAAAAGAAVVQFAKLTQEVNKNRKEVALLTSETGKALDNITAKLRATTSTFGKDFNEVLRAANTLSKEFGVSLSESIDNVNEGFLRGLDVNGQYLDTLNEYSTFIKEAGLNQEQFNVLIQKQVTQGIYSDKGIDAIKEAVISIREMTPATKQAIDAIGISSDTLIKDIQSGTKTYFEAVQEIAAKTQEIADPTKTGTILADVFRGAGEDAGNFIFTLGDVQEGYAKLSIEQESYILKQRALLESSEKVNEQLVSFSSNFSSATTALETFGNKIATETLKSLNAFVELFISAEEQMINFKNSLGGSDANTLKSVIADLNKEIEENENTMRNLEATYNQLAANVFKEKVAELKEELKLAEDQLSKVEEAERKEKEEQERARKEKEEAARVIIAKTEADKAEAEALKEKLRIQREERDEFATIKGDRDSFDAETDAFIKNFETKKDRESEFTDWLNEENKRRAENADEYRANDLDNEIDHQERKKELISASVDGFLDILEGFNQLRIAQIGQELQANEMARNRELELAEGNAAKQKAINEKFDKEQSKLRTKQANQEKISAAFSIAVNTARGVISALASVPPNVPLSIIIGAIGAAQLGFVAAQKPPKFAKGVIGLNGPGTDTSDSIPAYLSRNESVMTAKETKDYNATLWAIRKKEIKPEILNKFVLEGQKAPVVINDYDRLAEAVMRQPKFNMNMDENGFTLFMNNSISRRQVKQNKFKM